MEKYTIFDDLSINLDKSQPQPHQQNFDNQLPLPNDNFDQFFSDPNEIDFLFNETLNNLQDLDVPSGFANSLQLQPNTYSHSRQFSKSRAGHSRQLSGTAIFGYTGHNRDLSIGGTITNDLYNNRTPNINFNSSRSNGKSIDLKSISPGDLFKAQQPQNETHFPQNNFIDQEVMNFNFEEKPVLLLEEDEEDEEKYQKRGDKNEDFVKYQSSPIKRISTPETQIKTSQSITQPRTAKQNEYIVTNDNPTSYKFPPSPTPSRYSMPPPIQSSSNVYTAKYLQSLNGKNNDQPYVDDIEPLLDNDLKYIPIPVQNPKPKVNKLLPATKQGTSNVNFPNTNEGLNFNTYLPPPTPPTLSNGSPDWQSSPEPHSPSPGRAPLVQQSQPDISPIRNTQQQQQQPFYKPIYNSKPLDQPQYYQQQLLSSPYSTINSSPIKYYSPAKLDQDTTLTPIKNPRSDINCTPIKQKLEWSPVISPNSKQSLSKQIKNTSSRVRIKKTSLLPPGELDNYWIGPDENKIYTCTYKNCGKNFTRRYNVRSHIQTHLSDRPFGCMYCPKRFVRQHDLNRHIKGHIEARESKCPCGKEFARIDALRKHQDRNICIGGINGIIHKPPKKSKSNTTITTNPKENLILQKLEDQLNESKQDLFNSA